MLPKNNLLKVTTTYLKKHNEALILRAIYAHESISRVNLAGLTHLSRPSVTELTQSLLKKGLIAEIGPEKVSEKVGKKPTLLAFKPDAYQIIAVVVSDTTLLGTLMDLRIQEIEAQSLPMNGASGDELIKLIFALIQSLVECASRPILGITVGTPGIVDSETGIIHLATNLDWKSLPLAKLISDHFHIPVYVGNDSNLAAIGEYRFGLSQGIGDLVVMQIGTGIGAGILTDGRIVQGSTYAAGELGHLPLPTLHDICICGRRGCLETLVSWWGLRRHAQRIAREYPDSMLNALSKHGEISIQMIQQAVQHGDPETIKLVKLAATHLGQVLTIIIHTLNPKKIIFTGGMVELGDLFFDEVRRTVKDQGIPYITDQTEIITTPHDDNTILLGAGALLLERELGL
jgi:N-acetylglucosamine repressor